MESAGNEHQTNNRHFYAFKLYGRHVEHVAFDAVTFCDGKATGTYVNDNLETIGCENDSFEGGWTRIFQYSGDKLYGDSGVIWGALPSWYRAATDAPFDQYLWIDEGTTLDFAEGNADWTTEGYDAGKHYFFA